MKNNKIVFLAVLISFIGSSIILGAIILSVLAYTSSLNQTHEAEKRAKIGIKQSYEACKRSRYLGPILAEAYEKHHYFTDEQAKYYRMTIPKVCHK